MKLKTVIDLYISKGYEEVDFYSWCNNLLKMFPEMTDDEWIPLAYELIDKYV